MNRRSIIVTAILVVISTTGFAQEFELTPFVGFQGGGLTVDFQEKSAKATIQNEAKNGLKNKRGTLAMARMPEPHTASSQFFINHANNSFLDYGQAADGWGYCVFGKVIEGMDVVDAIANSPTMTKNGMGDVPRETIQILSITLLE